MSNAPIFKEPISEQEELVEMEREELERIELERLREILTRLVWLRTQNARHSNNNVDFPDTAPLAPPLHDLDIPYMSPLSSPAIRDIERVSMEARDLAYEID